MEIGKVKSQRALQMVSLIVLSDHLKVTFKLFKIPFLISFFIFCLWVSFLHIYLKNKSVQGLWRPEKDSELPGTGVTDSHECHVSAGTQT